MATTPHGQPKCIGRIWTHKVKTLVMMYGSHHGSLDEMTHYHVGHGGQEYEYYRDCAADIAVIGVVPKETDIYLVKGQATRRIDKW